MKDTVIVTLVISVVALIVFGIVFGTRLYAKNKAATDDQQPQTPAPENAEASTPPENPEQTEEQ